jgi:hypothetical protein
MSTEKVNLYYDTFMVGLLPKNESRINKDKLVLKGTDGTSIIVEKNPNTVYKEVPRKVFEAVPDKSCLFKFIFPPDTVVNKDASVFTTPSNSVYTFTNGYNAHNQEGEFTKMVYDGTIQIKPPDKTNEGIKQTTEIINNAVINAASISENSFLDDMKDNPFYNIFLIMFNVMRDMIVVLMYWIIFISISCWVMVPSDYLYPTDVTLYPFTFYKTVGKYYDYLTPEEDDICKTKIDIDNNRSREIQKKLFDEYKKFESEHTEKKDILNAIYPELLKKEEGSLNMFSNLLIRTCGNPELDITAQIRYVIVILLFQNFIYCNRIMSIIHSTVSAISTNILAKLDNRLLVILFAGLLYSFFVSSSEIKDKVIKMFKITFKEETDMNSIISNQFTNFFVYILAACMSIFIPLCSILSVACLVATTYILFKNIIAPFNSTIWIFSLVTVLFSIGSYLSLGLMIGGVMDPKELITFNDASSLSLIVFIFSLVGVGLPLLSAIVYSGYISIKIFVSFFSFLKMDLVFNRIKKSIPSLVIVALLFLILHVKEILGNTYTFITLTIIILVGIYVLMKGN